MSNETWEECRERENAEREAKYKELRAITGKLKVEGFTLAPSVMDPDSSSYDRYYSAAKLVHKDGREIWLTWSKNAGQIHVSAHLANDMHYFKSYNTHTPNINVSASKSPEVITRDIERRLVPEYTALYNECLTKLNASNAYEALSDRNVREIAKAFNAEICEPRHGDKKTVREVSWYHSRSTGCYGDAKANGDSIELNLRGLTVAEVKKIAAILRKK
jgi:hypothetical protein